MASSSKKIKLLESLLGRQIEITCSDLDKRGRGIAKWNKQVILIEKLLPDEIALVELKYKSGPFLVGEIIKIIETSKNRRDPRCDIADICGSCTIQHLKQQSQISLKSKQLKDVLTRIGGINDVNVEIDTRINQEYQYRNKAIIPIEKDVYGKLNFGYYMHNSHKIINFNSCPVLDYQINQILEIVKSDLNLYNLKISNGESNTLGLKHIVVRVGINSNEIMIAFVSNTDNIIIPNKMILKWVGIYPNIKSVVLNIQPNNSNIIFGNKSTVIYGDNYIKEIFCNLEFYFDCSSFFQINTNNAELAIKSIIDWLSYEGVKNVLDAFCGIGTISLPLAKHGFNVFGIEINPSSIILAKYNATKNGLLADFISGDVSNLLVNYINKYEAIVVDPPRKGLNDLCIQTILKSKPSHIVYMSCDKATLARDLSKLVKPLGLYKIQEIKGYDFFPQTMHLEVICFMKLDSLFG